MLLKISHSKSYRFMGHPCDIPKYFNGDPMDVPQPLPLSTYIHLNASEDIPMTLSIRCIFFHYMCTP